MPIFRVGKPKMKIGLLADVNIAAGSHTIPLDRLVWSEGDVTMASDGIVIGKGGLYLVVASLSRDSGAANTQMQVIIWQNGLKAPDTTTVLTSQTSTVQTSQVVEFIPCAAGDVLTLRGTLSSTAAINARASNTFLSAVRVGPERWT